MKIAKYFMIIILSIVASIIFFGCSEDEGFNLVVLEHSVNPPDEDNDQNRSDDEDKDNDQIRFDVEFVVDGKKVSDKTVSPGDSVKLTATVEAIKSKQLIFRWVNVTEYGTLSNTDQSSTVWTAPTNLTSGEVKVEVIHLVVTAISQITSVADSKVDTDTEIHTAIKTISLTVIG